MPQWQYSKILRRDLYRTLTASCQAGSGYTATDIADVLNPWLKEESTTWKNGYTYTLGGGNMWEPMAVAIMIGLLFATVITLLFIPVLYRILFKVSYKGY